MKRKGTKSSVAEEAEDGGVQAEGNALATTESLLALATQAIDDFEKQKQSISPVDKSASKSDSKINTAMQPKGNESKSSDQEQKQAVSGGAASPAVQDMECASLPTGMASVEAASLPILDKGEDDQKKESLAEPGGASRAKEADTVLRKKAASAVSEGDKDRKRKSRAKRHRSRHGRSKKHEKSVQTSLEGATGPPIHVLLSPSPCRLCEDYAPYRNDREYLAHGLSRPDPTRMADIPRASPIGESTTRGATKKTITTTRRVKGRKKSDGGSNSFDSVEETTTEVIEQFDAAKPQLPSLKDSRAVTAFPSKAGHGGVGEGTKKKVIITRTQKIGDKNGFRSEPRDYEDEITIETIESPNDGDAGIQTPGGLASRDDSDGFRAAGTPSLPKEGGAGGVIKKTVRTTRRGKSTDKDRGRSDLPDFDEEIVTEVVEPLEYVTPQRPGREHVKFPFIDAVARDASSTQYRYTETRRPAQGPSLPLPLALAIGQRMQLQAAPLWPNQGYRHPAPSECPLHRPGAVRHQPGCRLAVGLQENLTPCLARNAGPWFPVPPPPCERTGCPLHGDPTFTATAVSTPMLSCAGAPEVDQPCYTFSDHTPVSWAANDGPVMSPPMMENGGMRGPELVYEVSDATYDIYGEPDVAAEDSGTADDAWAPCRTDFIWETPARREEFVYCSRETVNPAVTPLARGATWSSGRGFDIETCGHWQDNRGIRAAKAAIDISKPDTQRSTSSLGRSYTIQQQAEETYLTHFLQHLPDELRHVSRCALSAVDEASETPLDDIRNRKPLYEQVSWPTGHFVSQLKRSTEQTSSEGSDEEKRRGEQKHHSETRGAGEAANEHKLVTSAKNKRRHKGRRLSKTEKKELTFSISPTKSRSDDAQNITGKVSTDVVHKVVPITYSTTSRPNVRRGTVEVSPDLPLSPASWMVLEPGSDPYSASIPLYDDHYGWLPPFGQANSRRASEVEHTPDEGLQAVRKGANSTNEGKQTPLHQPDDTERDNVVSCMCQRHKQITKSWESHRATSVSEEAHQHDLVLEAKRPNDVIHEFISSIQAGKVPQFLSETTQGSQDAPCAFTVERTNALDPVKKAYRTDGGQGPESYILLPSGIKDGETSQVQPLSPLFRITKADAATAQSGRHDNAETPIGSTTVTRNVASEKMKERASDPSCLPFNADTASQLRGRCSVAGSLSGRGSSQNAITAARGPKTDGTVSSTSALTADFNPSICLREGPECREPYNRNQRLGPKSLVGSRHRAMKQPSHPRRPSERPKQSSVFPALEAAVNVAAASYQLTKDYVDASTERKRQFPTQEQVEPNQQCVKHTSHERRDQVGMHQPSPSVRSSKRPRPASLITATPAAVGSMNVPTELQKCNQDTSSGIRPHSTGQDLVCRQFPEHSSPRIEPDCLPQRTQDRRANLGEEPATDGAWRPKPLPRAVKAMNDERETAKQQHSDNCLSRLRKLLPAEAAKPEPSCTEVAEVELPTTSDLSIQQSVYHRAAPTVAAVKKPERDSEDEQPARQDSRALAGQKSSEGNVRAPLLTEDVGAATRADQTAFVLNVKSHRDQLGEHDDYMMVNTVTSKETKEQKRLDENELIGKHDADTKTSNEITVLQDPLNADVGAPEFGEVAMKLRKSLAGLEQQHKSTFSQVPTVARGRGCLPEIQIFPLHHRTWNTARMSRGFLYPEVLVAIITSISCVVWVATFYPIRSPEIMQVFHMMARKTTVRPTPAASLHTFWTTKEKATESPLPTDPPRQPYLCSTLFCLREAAYLKSMVRKDLSPCDNFHKYACGTWESYKSLSAVGLGVSYSLDIATEEFMASKFRDFILVKQNAHAVPLRMFYKACMAPHRYTTGFLRANIFPTLPITSWPFNDSEGPLQIWRTAGILLRKYGVTALLKVIVGVERTRDEPTVEIEFPHPLFFSGDELRPKVMRMFAEAIREAAEEFGAKRMSADLTAQIISVFTSLAKLRRAAASRDCRVRRLKHLDYSVRAFLAAVFERDIHPNTTVVVREPHLVLGGLVRLTHDLKVQSFLNYLGFRLLVRLAVLFPNRLVNLRRLFSVEFNGRVVRDDMKWFLCVRFLHTVRPFCLEEAQAKMSSTTTEADLARRLWLLQIEDFFARNMRRLAWISENTLTIMEEKIKRYRFFNFFPGDYRDNETGCSSAPGSLFSSGHRKESQVIRAVLMALETRQKFYLGRIKRSGRPRDAGFVFETHPRFSEGQQAVYVPAGLINASVPENSTMLAFQLPRVATRLFRALVPVACAHWSEGQCSAPWTPTRQTRRSLARLRMCLAKDLQSLPQQLRPEDTDVLLGADGEQMEEAGYAILAQTAALGLAFAAFKEMLRVDRIWRLDFRLAPLASVSAEQLFFLYYALDNCDRSDPAYRAHTYGAWGRLPAEHRVNLPLRQMARFATAWGCTPGSSGMAPKKRCAVMRWPAPRKRPAQGDGR